MGESDDEDMEYKQGHFLDTSVCENERREKSESVSCGSKQSYRSLINTI